MHSLGADRVIDYTREDFTTGSDRYDIVLDCHASRPLLACAGILAPTGRNIIVGAPGGGLIGPLRPAVKAFALAPFVRRTLTIRTAVKRATRRTRSMSAAARKAVSLRMKRYCTEPLRGSCYTHQFLVAA